METTFESELMSIKALLKNEIDAYQNLYAKVNDIASLREKVRKGYAIYPLNIFDVRFDKLGQVLVEIEKVPYWPRMLSSGSPARIYAINSEEYANVIIGKIGYEKVEIVLDKDDVPDWIKGNKLALLIRPDDRSFKEMERAIEALEDKKNEEFRRIFRVAYGLEETENSIVPFQNEELNDSQNLAVQQIIGNNKVVVVHGPPGTGKTTTLVQAIFEMIKQNKKILVATPSNAAADHMTRELLEYSQKVVRVGNPVRIDDELEKHSLSMLVRQSEEAKLIKEYQKEINKNLKKANTYKRNFGIEERKERGNLRKEIRTYRKQIKELEKFSFDRILSDNRVAVGTLIGLCRTEIKKQKWDVVVIDEAAQAFEPACWAVASFGEKLILAGDHQQLPPTLVQEFPLSDPYKTLQEKIIERNPKTVSFLDTQYRMTPSIQEFSNREFYEGKLIVGREYNEDDSITFIDTAGCGYDEETKDQSKFNSGEGNLVVELVKEAALNYSNIGVISPYSQQVKFIKSVIPEMGENNIQTIDGFQGQERGVIIISLVRSNPEGNVGFLKDYRRMNVALTRAKDKLIVVGDSATIGQDPFYNRFLNYVEEVGEYRSAWEWM